MKNYNLIWTKFLALAFGLTVCTEAEGRKKNVILIMADDISYDNYSCYGSTYFSTPNLDNLAATGIRFTNAHATPVCTPSRVRIMTGRDASHSGNYIGFRQLSPNEPTFVSPMKDAGYITAISGKWQLDSNAGTPPEDTGFDRWLLNNTRISMGERFWDVTNDGTEENVELEEDGTLALMEVTYDDYGPDKCTDFLIDFITTNAANEFFVYYPMILVHNPFVATPDSTDRYSENGSENYKDMVAYMDKLIGQIITVLDDLGIREDTIIIYTGDNGTNRGLEYPFMGETRDGRKAYPVDGGTHVALIANCPGTIPTNQVCEDLIDFTDVFPTLCDIAEVPMPTNRVMDGRSFLPQLLGQPGNAKRIIYQTYYPKNTSVIAEYGNPAVWAHTEKYKLYKVAGTLTEDTRFYNLEDDRDEVNPITYANATADEKDIWDEFQTVLDSLPKTRKGVSYNSWQDRNFTAEQVTAGLADPTLDVDGDGQTNEDEYIMVSPPQETGGFSFTTAQISETGAYPTLQFKRRIDIDATYSIESTTTLLSNDWQNVDAQVTLLGKSINDDGTETVVYQYQIELEEDPMYFRIKASY